MKFDLYNTYCHQIAFMSCSYDYFGAYLAIDLYHKFFSLWNVTIMQFLYSKFNFRCAIMELNTSYIMNGKCILGLKLRLILFKDLHKVNLVLPDIVNEARPSGLLRYNTSNSSLYQLTVNSHKQKQLVVLYFSIF